MYNTHRRAPGHLVLTRCGTFETLPAALAAAERLHDPALKGVTITVEQADDPKPLASLSTRPIMGLFTKQAWGGYKNDNALFIAHELFDATAYITSLPHEDLIALEDNRESTDVVGIAHVKWDGPHEVEIVDSICEYFGVSKLEHITASHHAYVKQMLQVFSEAQRVQTRNLASPLAAVSKVERFLGAIARMALPSEMKGPAGNGADPDDAQLALSRLIVQSRELIAERGCVEQGDAPAAPR